MMHPGDLTLTGVSGTMTETVAHEIPDKYISADIVRKRDMRELTPAVYYDAYQDLTDDQKEIARKNIGVGVEVVNAHYFWTSDHTNDVFWIYSKGASIGIITGVTFADGSPLVVFFGNMSYGRVEAMAIDPTGSIYNFTLNLSTKAEPEPIKIATVKLNSDGTLPQQVMQGDPTNGNHIATKSYVDTAVQDLNNRVGLVFRNIRTSNGFILPSTTEGSNKRFELTVDDSGKLSVTEMEALPS